MLKWILSFLASVAFCAFLVVVDRDKNEKRHAERDLREMHRTSRGVDYFYECIDGFQFIATPSTHHYFQLSGPVGRCDE